MSEATYELPFHALTDTEFLREIGAWIYKCAATLESKDLFSDIITNPDKRDNDNFSFNIESNYLDVKNTTKALQIGNKGFSLLHCNARNRRKNLTLLNDILLLCKELPSVIAISETKLNENSIDNVSIDGYRFLSKTSPSNAGGVGLYLKNEIDFVRRRDLEFDFESVETCFADISNQKGKNIIFACIYRHPSNQIQTFQDLLSEKLQIINQNGYEAYLVGDININFLSYHSHRPTSDYLDMLFELGYMPLITKATRITYHSKTLIDHIHTNTPEKLIKSGICLADITDHLPCFCTFSTKITICNDQYYFRDFSTFKNNEFIADLNKINFMFFLIQTSTKV